MGTEVAMSFSALRTQLENEKSSLFKIDENIKKIQVTGRFTNDRFNNSAGDYSRGPNRLGGRNSFPEAGNNYKNEEQFGKRKHETKIVFSRLSARVREIDDDDDEVPSIKKARVNSTVSRELPTRAAVLRAQGDDEQARTRNRRIFGSLLGTLQKFKQEEIVLQTKEDKKAQVERKIEEQARQEKEREQKERKTLYAEREHKKATIKALEAKMARVQEFEKWEESQKNIANFILTKTKPHIYWLPKKMTEKGTEKLISSRKFHETKYGPLYRKCMIKKRQELEEELQRIEQRCLRPRGPAAKENHPEQKDGEDKEMSLDQDQEMKEVEGGRKRNKFAMDADEKEREDSDGDEPSSDKVVPKIEKESDESKLDTSVDQSTTIEANSTMETEALPASTNGTSATPEDSHPSENHTNNKTQKEDTKPKTEETKTEEVESKNHAEETKSQTGDAKNQEEQNKPANDSESET